MRNFSKVFDFQKEKNANKVYAALQKGRGQELLNSLMTEAQAANAADYPKAQLIITGSFVCSYQEFKNSLYIIPLEDIVNVYVSNCFYGTYNYDNKAIALETRAGETFYFSKVAIRSKEQQFEQALMALVARCKANANSLIA